MAQAMAQRPARPPMPRPIRRALGRIDRRLRALAAVRGLGTAGLVAALGAAAGMAVDFGWGLPRAAHWGVWLAWIGAASATLLAALARGLARRSRALDLAAVLERSDPTLGERLTGAVDLLGGRAHGSAALIAALADDAAAHVGAIDPARALPARGSWRRFALGVLAVALVAAPAMLREDPFGRLARRFLMPWADLDRVGLYSLSVAPGDAFAAIGDDLTISARVAPRFGRSPAQGEATLEWTEAATGRTRRMAMTEANSEANTSAADRAFSVVLPRLTDSLTYRVASRSGESRRFRVTAVAPPAVASIEARVEPPSYTRFPPFGVRNAARIEAWEDSRVRLTIKASAPVVAVEVAWPEPVASESAKAEPRQARVAATIAADGRTATVALKADASGEYAVTLRDAHGLTSRPEPSRRLVVRPDEPPVVAVRGAERLDEARPDDTLRVALDARDDVAVASAELHYTIERAATSPGSGPPETGRVVAKLSGLGTPSARGEVALGLKPLNLQPGDVVGYCVRVLDNRPAPRGPNAAWSGPGRLTIVAKADPLWSRRNQAGRAAIQKTLDALKKAAAENRHETEQLRYAADAVQRGNGAWDRDRQQELARREAGARDLVDKLQQFARELADDPAFRPLARPARQVAEVEAEAARATLDQARQADDPSKRFTDLRQADTRLGAVSNRLEELQSDLNALADRQADRGRLQTLADRQAEVAGKADAAEGDDHVPPDRARLDQLAAEQNAVKNGLDALLKKSPDLRVDVLDAQAVEAEALARRARELAAKQRLEARRATDLSKKAAPLKALADLQRALEDDARRLALDVDQPLAETGRGRLNTAPIRQAAEPIERGDLAQGRQQLEGAEHELRRLARDLEDAPGDLKVLARRLAQRQEQINNDLVVALGDARNKEGLPPAERKVALERLKPLAQRQKAVNDLAAAILATKEAKANNAEPRFPLDAARQAADAADRAARALAAPDNPREVEARGRESQAALNRLANELPDVGKREEPTRKAFAEARQKADDVANQVDRHLRETDRPLDKDHTPARAAVELAGRLAPLADRARQAAARLEAVEPMARVQPQHDRAAGRARALADAIEAARARAPSNPDAGRARALRDALAAAAVDSRLAFERFEHKLAGLTPSDEVAAELAEDQRALAAAAAAPPLERAEDQRRIATALRTLRAHDAALEHADAIRLAEQAARVLEHGDTDKPARGEAVRRASEAVEALADRLADRQTPRGRAEALARAERGLNDPRATLDPAAETARHRAVAATLTRLPQDETGKAAAAVQSAAELAVRALQPDEAAPGHGKPTLAEQADARTRAAESLDTLAAALPGGADKDRPRAVEHETTARDPDLPIDPDHAARARELARRERRLRERLQAILGERVGPQQDLRHEAVELGRELADLRDRAQSLSDRARGPAHEAAALVGEQAPRAMDAAADQLAQGQTAPARDAQRRAAELAERGAQSADDLAAALHANPESEAKHRADPSALAAARQAMSQATRSLGQAREPAQGHDALDAARQAMRGAAEQLQAAAEKARGQGSQSEPGEGEAGRAVSQTPSASDPRGGKAGVADPAALDDLQELVRRKTGRKWGELPGHLRSEILQMSQGRYRDDYARLIQLYFREIAAGADGPRGLQP
jgi:hypothetical protein